MYSVEVTFHTPNESHISLIYKYSLCKSKVTEPFAVHVTTILSWLSLTLFIALPLPDVSFTASSSQIVSGGQYSLTCTVQVVRFLANQPNITWLDARGDPPLGNGITVERPRRLNTTTTLRFTIDQLDQSHLGVYTCRACVSIDKAAIQEHCSNVTAEITLEGE